MKTKPRIAKLYQLYLRGATPGEKQAAQQGIQRLVAKQFNQPKIKQP